jgi:hypothetical protein
MTFGEGAEARRRFVITAGQRATFKTPRGPVYGKVLYLYSNRPWARFEPDAGSTYGGGVLTTLDTNLDQLDATDVAFQPVAL